MLLKISPRVDFISPVTHLFDTDGNLVHRLEELEEGQSYVAANNRRFVPANYGRTGEAFFQHRGGGGGGGRYSSLSASQQQLAYNRRRRRSLSSKSSSADSASKLGSGSTDGKIIKIINNDEPSLSERVLLNLKTSQTFEEVVHDLGQVLRLKGADRLYALDGREVRSFSHLRQQFADESVFVIAAGPAKVNREIARLPRTHSEPALRRSVVAAPVGGGHIPPPRSAALDSPLSSRDSESPAAAGSIKILINGVRRIYYPPVPPPLEDTAPPSRRPVLEWVYGYRGADQVQCCQIAASADILL
jgi:hypothetical protein